MCEWIYEGDVYTKCRHFRGRFHTHDQRDCGRTHCKNSSKHIHHPKDECDCPAIAKDYEKTVNMFHLWCPRCLEPKPLLTPPPVSASLSRTSSSSSTSSSVSTSSTLSSSSSRNSRIR
ncbi:hypothetical protein SISNIDRAFT_211671 [Sistotremastrum niveocremeum HHB9708]|uniref:Uncharacterized protein n=2 Tax=Sistotremastraceae TaxID=3402574 RepID=A0A164R2T6_9AGAM|nr:hypothetical protein SISNIDRAFT_211671 [Sistotremastrum niveocremeum HHB9708]KZT35263.1 hypothetical protein SISSUDRAFT_188411 [Sistotremastrum suecicum HHB10207 ss-3]